MASDWIFYPYYLHLHFKRRIPSSPSLNTPYPIELCLSNEIDMFRSVDIASEPPIVLNFSVSPNIFRVKIEDGRPTIDKSGRCSVVVSLSSNMTGNIEIPEFVQFNVSANSKRILAAVQLLSLSKDKSKMHEYDCNSNEHDHGFEAGNGVVIIKEIAGREVGCRIWDCAIYVREYLLSILKMNPLFFDNQSVLDLGSGNGFVSIWLSQHLTTTQGNTKVTCSDLEELLDLMNLNVSRNKVNVECKVIKWGEPCEDRYDFIIASDVMYQPALFPDLLTTLSEILSPKGKVLLVFRSRGKDEDHKGLFFDMLPKYGLKYRDAKNPNKIGEGRCFFVLMERE